MPNKDAKPDAPDQTPAEEVATELDTWLRGNDEDPDRYDLRPDGSVKIEIRHPYRVVDKGDPPGPKLVTLRPMYAADWRALSDDADSAMISAHDTVLRLGDIPAHDLDRMQFVDYSATLIAAQGVLEKKFRPTS